MLTMKAKTIIEMIMMKTVKVSEMGGSDVEFAVAAFGSDIFQDCRCCYCPVAYLNGTFVYIYAVLFCSIV